MTVLAVCAANGGVGATTTAVALGASWPTGDVLVAELDASGGDLAAWCDSSDQSGTAALAADRWDGTAATLDPAVLCCLAVGVPVLCGPVRRASATVVAAQVAGPLVDCFSASATALIVDAGAVTLGGPPWVGRADATLVVARQDVDSPARTAVALERAAELIDSLAARAAGVSAVVVGRAPFGAGEIAGYLGVACRTIEHDALGATTLAATRTRRGWARGALARSVRAVAADLADSLTRPRASEEEVA